MNWGGGGMRKKISVSIVDVLFIFEPGTPEYKSCYSLLFAPGFYRQIVQEIRLQAAVLHSVLRQSYPYKNNNMSTKMKKDVLRFKGSFTVVTGLINYLFISNACLRMK